MRPASMLVARNVREDIGSAFVAVLLLASAVMVAYLAAAGLPSDAADGVLSASPAAEPSRAEVPAAAADFAGAPVRRLPPLTVVGHREAVPTAAAGERQPRRAQDAHAKTSSAPRA